MAKKVDRNQSSFVAACVALGGGAVDYHEAGRGKPDVVLYGSDPYRTGEICLAEIKGMGGRPTEPEVEFFRKHWQVCVVVDTLCGLFDLWGIKAVEGRARLAMAAYLAEMERKECVIPYDDEELAAEMELR